MTENQEFKSENIGLIIAGGFSSRAKTFKMTLPYKDSTVIENIIVKMLTICEKVIIVGGYSFKKLKYLEKKYENIKLIYNENFEEGMYSSIKKGFFHIKNMNYKKLIYSPGDYPAVTTELYRNLIAQEGKIIIPFHKYEKRKGHPIVISLEMIKNKEFEIFNNLRDFLKEEEAVFFYTEDNGILVDLDTMEDYQKLLELDKEVKHHDFR